MRYEPISAYSIHTIDPFLTWVKHEQKLFLVTAETDAIALKASLRTILTDPDEDGSTVERGATRPSYAIGNFGYSSHSYR